MQIRALDSQRRTIADGTGFFVASNGLIVTNVHVIRGARKLEIEAPNGDVYDLVYLVTADPRRDIAILKVPVDNAHSLALASDDAAEVGAPVFVMGNPLGQVGTFSNGLVSAQRSVDGVTLVQITAPVSPGSSGGPVMNALGEVIGVTTLMLRGGQNLNYAVPVRYVRPLAASRDEPRLYAEHLVPRGSDGLAAISSEPRSTSRDDASPEPRRVRDVIASQFRIADSITAANGGRRIGNIVRGSLDALEVGRHRVSLNSDSRYFIVAYCDEDCGDLDLEISDEEGNVVASDSRADDSPFLNFSTSTAQTYILRVTMASCDASPCAYGVRLYGF